MNDVTDGSFITVDVVSAADGQETTRRLWNGDYFVRGTFGEGSVHCRFCEAPRRDQDGSRRRMSSSNLVGDGMANRIIHNLWINNDSPLLRSVQCLAIRCDGGEGGRVDILGGGEQCRHQLGEEEDGFPPTGASSAAGGGLNPLLLLLTIVTNLVCTMTSK